jgi:5'-3' exoribonuclease 2
MLSLKSRWSDSIFLLRDNTFNEKLKDNSVDKTFTYVNIRELKKCICEEMKNNLKRCCLTTNQLINDYTTLCFLLGNDFLEHIPTLVIKGNGINVLQNAYYKVINRNNGRTLVDNVLGKVDLRILTDIVGEIASLEESYYKYKYAPIKCREPFADSDEIVYLSDSNFMNLKASGGKERYYIYYGICNVEHACFDWVTGILWTQMYYDGHKHDNWSWSYNHHATPFASDIYDFLKRNLEEINKSIGENTNLTQSIPTCMKLQLLLVLPQDTLMKVLEKEYKERLQRICRCESEEIKQIFPQKLTIDLIDKEYLWQSKIFFKSMSKSVDFLKTIFA